MVDKSFLDITEEADSIVRAYEKISTQLDLSKSGDAWLAKNISTFLDQLSRLSATCEKVNLLSAFEGQATPHPYESEKIINARGWRDSSMPVAIQKWRKNSDVYPYTSIPDELKKEIFDYFFRFDVHGELEDESTILLSRGVSDPEYFRPPTIVNVALDVASKNNWFGYSDSLGHEETREAIAALERVRRNQDSINIKNTAVVQGGTAGLHAVLSMLCRKEKRKGCVVATPTYAPILDDVAHHYEPRILQLTDNYQADYDRMVEMISKGDVSAVLISIPHNPYGFRDFDDHLDRLHEVCFENGVFLICDEIIFDEKISPVINPIDYPNLITIASYSKAYNIPGLKLGHILARPDFLNDFYRHASTTYGSPPSFLYLTATCLTAMEKSVRDNEVPNLPIDVSEQFSNPAFAFEDFKLWKRLGKAHSDFQNLVVSKALSNLGHVGLETILGLDDPSSNVVVRMKNRGNTYSSSMNILASRNVSSMPIECFSPAGEWPRDLRTTIAIEPEQLVIGFPQLICGIDDIVAEETKEEWLCSDDIEWLQHLGLQGLVKGANSWGRAKRIQTRLHEIFSLAGKTSVPENLERSASLISLRHTWSQLPETTIDEIFSNLTGANTQDSQKNIGEIFRHLVTRFGRLSNLPKLPNAVEITLAELARHPISYPKHSRCELSAIAAAESLQGISLARNDLNEVKATLEAAGRTQEFTALVETIEKIKTLEM